jgi:hypothetical protein
MSKSWGPFSGRQLTLIIVTAIVALFVPGTVWAVDTFSNVAIEDPVSGVKASVDAGHHLLVGDGSGPLTVDGTVSGRPAAPASPWRASQDIQGQFIFIAGPSSSPIDLTSLSISTDASSGANLNVYLDGAHVPSTATSCAGATLDGTIWHIRDAGDGVTPVSFALPTPLQWKPPSNTKACLAAEAATASTTTINAVGFYGG